MPFAHYKSISFKYIEILLFYNLCTYIQIPKYFDAMPSWFSVNMTSFSLTIFFSFHEWNYYYSHISQSLFQTYLYVFCSWSVIIRILKLVNNITYDMNFITDIKAIDTYSKQQDLWVWIEHQTPSYIFLFDIWLKMSNIRHIKRTTAVDVRVFNFFQLEM